MDSILTGGFAANPLKYAPQSHHKKLGTPMILCFTSFKIAVSDSACHEKPE
jgi:hypothetical protein